jgi:hypothetical protein
MYDGLAEAICAGVMASHTKGTGRPDRRNTASPGGLGSLNVRGQLLVAKFQG